MTEPCNVLISSAGRRVALLDLFRRALRDLGLEGRVFAADMAKLSSAYHSADGAFVVPRCTSDAFVPEVLRLCREHRIRLVVPTIDTELPVYAAHRAAFEAEGVTVAVSTPEVVAIGGDKHRTHEWLVRSGLPAPRQATAEAVLADPSGWTFPLVAKPAGGSSSIGLAIVNDLAQLEAASRGGGYVVQSLAPGREYTIDFLADRGGSCLCAIPRKRLEVRAGEVSKAVTVRDPALEGLARRVCAALPGAYGCLNVQVFKDDATGELNVIEVNARFGGGFPLAWEAGGHYPRWILEELLGLPSTAAADRWRSGLVMLRYDAAVFVDAAAAGL